VTALLHRCAQLAAQLEQALIAETDALTRLDTPALMESNRHKHRLFTELARHIDDGGLRRLLSEDSGQAENPQVSELVDCLKRCRSMNEVAGSSIAMLLRNTREALTLLGVADEPRAYGASGRQTTDSNHRALAVC